MDTRKHLLIINGEDQSDSVVSYHFSGAKCDVVYKSSTNSPTVYHYNRSNVRVLNLQKTIDPYSVIIWVEGAIISNAEQLLDFGLFYRIVCKEQRDRSYLKQEVTLEASCLGTQKNRDLFNYFKETARSVSLVTDEGKNILSMQYEKVTGISEKAVLASYMGVAKASPNLVSPTYYIYPFGLNQSQKVAVENAFSSQVSIIQGPPGTGKTQTILNIIANAVINGKTVAVVSNNNAATFNVVEKLAKQEVAFLTAFLGSSTNKDKFIEKQDGVYPNMDAWTLLPDEKSKLSSDVQSLSDELNKRLKDKNRIAAIEQELLALKLEEHYFNEYYFTYDENLGEERTLLKISSEKLFALWLEYENSIETNTKLGLWNKLLILLRFKRAALELFKQPVECAIPFLQKQFYLIRRKELQDEMAALEKSLNAYSFDGKMEELVAKSLRLFRSALATRYDWRNARNIFTKSDFRSHSDAFNVEYPVILSTTYSIKSTLSVGHLYDYLIIDEASQVDIATGVLAFSCARNVVIVGDQQQLPNVLSGENARIADEIWSRYNFDEAYHFSKQSLLSSASCVWKDAPSTLLREHYRCHPKIIEFCNQKFYDGKLIVMTKDHDEQDVLTMYRTVAGNHARGHFNQRQIDVIKTEVLPKLQQQANQSIGIIAPYREQVSAIAAQLGEGYEVATVHKFQGREKDAIVLASVDDVIGEFVDDPHLLNVAVSRAVNSLSIVISQDERNNKTNFGDLAKYIEYNNCEIVNSTVFSVFDLLYKGYAEQRKTYLRKHKHISKYDSENLMYSIIEHVLDKPSFFNMGCAIHVGLSTLVKDYNLLDENERQYAHNHLTHVDFLLYNKMDKLPVMAVEVDGTAYHQAGSQQAERDKKKNTILKKCCIPVLRVRTDESGEEEKLEELLHDLLK